MDNEKQLTAADIRKMNRDDLDAAAADHDIDPDEYSKASDLQAALIEKIEGGQGGANTGLDLRSPQEQAIDAPAYKKAGKTLEAVEHNKGRRVVNVVK